MFAHCLSSNGANEPNVRYNILSDHNSGSSLYAIMMYKYITVLQRASYESPLGIDSLGMLTSLAE